MAAIGAREGTPRQPIPLRRHIMPKDRDKQNLPTGGAVISDFWVVEPQVRAVPVPERHLRTRLHFGMEYKKIILAYRQCCSD